MILIVGLGNPDRSFFHTRHNIGFEIIDSIQQNHHFNKYVSKFEGLCSKKKIMGKNIILFKPLTYMNLSGRALKKIVDFYKINISENLIVIHDDLDMDFCKMKIKTKGGHGGHNGIKNIIEMIGDEFIRIKFGIKNSLLKEHTIKPEKFVLEKFSEDELKKIEDFKQIFSEDFKLIIEKKFSLLKKFKEKEDGI